MKSNAVLMDAVVIAILTNLAEGTGIEPVMTESKSAVLPLH